MDRIISYLAATVAANAKEGLTPTAMPNVSLYKVSQCVELVPEIYQPVVSLILQGEKQLSIGSEVLTYSAGHTFTTALDIPALGVITQASAELPYLAIRLDVDPEIVSELAFRMPDLARTADQKGYGVDPASRDLLDAWSRMLGLIGRADEVPVMAPLLEREIVYRLLRGPQGAVLRQLAATDNRMSQIRKALAFIRQNHALPLMIEDIARLVGMSYSAFHRRFKAATGVAPLQYQKNIRLCEARRLLLTEPTTVSAAAFSVGYQSVSQFSREYRRMFGTPPMQEVRINRLN
ncbi:AraC family transcriptional regulator [Janthinobacterium sp. RB2R34]|uniref:AraC family transcriptional regulator n=1 Tax=Janthinobacterium sp. RB2R34 TaxID=3424193 RepID=UPI003F26D920